MNPLDLPGPAFLLFYVVLAVVVLVVAHLLRRWYEAAPTPSLREVDPYLVAHLRAGDEGALQLAVLSLLDRGLLRSEGDFVVARQDAIKKVRRPIEREVLLHFEVAGQAATITRSSSAVSACELIDGDLRARGLLPGRGAVLLRVLLGIAAVTLLFAVAFAKLEVAAARGHHNVGFLMFLMLAASVVVFLVLRRRRTTAGDRYLEDLRTMFHELKQRMSNLRLGGGTNELALVVGVFGAELLGGNVALWTKSLFPPPVKQWQYGSSSSCGSGGSSCGGGGCGGGCGGCGG